MTQINQLTHSIYNNDINNIRQLITTNPNLLKTQNSNGDFPLHTAVRYSHVAYNNNNRTNARNYQKIADYLVQNGARLNSLNSFNDKVVLNPKYNNNLSEIDISNNEYSDTFFSDTVKDMATSMKNTLSGVFNQSGGYNSDTSSDTLSDILNNQNSVSDTSSINLNQHGGNQSDSISISVDEEELTYENTDSYQEGGARRRRKSSKRRRKKSVSGRRRKRSVSRRKSSKRKSSRRRSKRSVSRRRRKSSSKKRRMKRGVNPYMTFLNVYRKSLGSNPGKPTDVAKKGGKIWRDAKDKAGKDATSEEVSKIAISMVEKNK